MGNKDRNKSFEDYLKNQPVPENEKAAIYGLFQDLDDIKVPEPSESMNSAFARNLEEYKLKQTLRGRGRFSWPAAEKLFGLPPVILRPAFATAIFLFGILGGLLINANRTEDQHLISDLQNTRTTLMLTLLEQSSATDRLKAVNLSGELENPDKLVTQALLATLNNDENVNVRLAAIEALFRYSRQPEVRKGLIEAIPNQDSPMVLITLSKAMVLLQEKGSVEKLKEVLNNNRLDEKAKERINENIQKII